LAVALLVVLLLRVLTVGFASLLDPADFFDASSLDWVDFCPWCVEASGFVTSETVLFTVFVRPDTSPSCESVELGGDPVSA
jgi:hypothetical protein